MFALVVLVILVFVGMKESFTRWEVEGNNIKEAEKNGTPYYQSYHGGLRYTPTGQRCNLQWINGDKCIVIGLNVIRNLTEEQRLEELKEANQYFDNDRMAVPWRVFKSTDCDIIKGLRWIDLRTGAIYRTRCFQDELDLKVKSIYKIVFYMDENGMLVSLSDNSRRSIKDEDILNKAERFRLEFNAMQIKRKGKVNIDDYYYNDIHYQFNTWSAITGTNGVKYYFQ